MAQDTLYPDYKFLEELERAGPFQAQACFQCRKCTNGCPVTFAMDLLPPPLFFSLFSFLNTHFPKTP